MSAALFPRWVGVIVYFMSFRGFFGRNPRNSDCSALPALSWNSYRTRGVGVTYRRTPVPVEIVERCARYYLDRNYDLFERGIPSSTLLNIDGYAIFHIAHGGLSRPINFAHGYGITSITLVKTLSIG